MKTLRDIREELVDVSSHSNRKLKTIIADPKHPHHAAAKAELDRRLMQQEEIAKAMQEGKSVEQQIADLEKYLRTHKGNTSSMRMKKIAIERKIKALKKQLTNEETEQIDEISDKMKDRYIQTSMGDHQHAKAVRKDAESRGDKDLASKMKDRMKKRNQGMTRAYGVAEASDTQMGTITVTTDAERKARAQAYRDKKAKEAMKKESTQIDEISSNKLANYMRASSADAGKPGTSAGRQDKRIAGQSMADKKIRKKMGYSSTAKVAAESTLDEVLDTPKAMDSYRAKAKYSNDRAANSAAAKMLRNKNGFHSTDTSDELKTMDKRTKGLKMADKAAARKTRAMMKKEEAEPVDEKSKGLWANIHAKRKRGEKPNPPGHPDRPTKADFERSQK